MPVDESALRQIAMDVCQTMLGLNLVSVDAPARTAGQLVASVEIRGHNHAAVDVFAHEDLTTAIAEAMFCSDRASLSRDDVHGAFGEIANIIGGNVKGLLKDQRDLSLSLPTVGEVRADHACSDAKVRATFDCCGHPLTVIVRESPASPKSSDKLTSVT